MRNLIQFIKNLALVNDLEELYKLLKANVKFFHQVVNIYLGFPSSQRVQQLMYSQTNEVMVRTVNSGWTQGVRLRVNQVEDSQYLANQFGKPIAKVIAIPLFVKGNFESDPGQMREGILFFEHTFKSGDEERFLQFAGECLQPLAITFDRILLDQIVTVASLMWERTFDGVMDPIAILDRDYMLMRNNLAFGETKERSICYKKFNRQDTVCSGCPVEEVFRTGDPQVGYVRKQNRMFEVHSYPIRLVTGSHLTNVVNYYVDVTLKQELQGKMIQNEKMAAIGHLAGNIAHELNNPLTGIRSMSQVLIQETDSQSQRYGDLVEVEKAAARCQSIITNLLEFSKETGSKHLIAISLNEIVSRTLPFLKVAMRSHACHVELSEDNPRVLVEPQLLQQVVFNIVNNACQAMENPGTLKVVTQVVERDSSRYGQLEVSDTGIGIPSENLESIFDPFFTTKKAGQGTGLGLSMSKNIIESMGGQIFVESVRGRGTVFRLELPLFAGEES